MGFTLFKKSFLLWIAVAALVPSFLSTSSMAEIQQTKIKPSKQLQWLDMFVFQRAGRVELNLTNISFSSNPTHHNLSQIGFYLSFRDYMVESRNRSLCYLHSRMASSKILYTLDQLGSGKSNTNMAEAAATISLDFLTESPYFSLIFENCVSNLEVSMSVRSAIYSLDGESGGKDRRRTYLSANKTNYIGIDLIFIFVYIPLASVWLYASVKRKAAGINGVVLLVFVFKLFSLWMDLLEKSYVQETGNPKGHGVLYFWISEASKVFPLTILLILIASGWQVSNTKLQIQYKLWLVVCISIQLVVTVLQIVFIKGTPCDIHCDCSFVTIYLRLAEWVPVFFLFFPLNFSTDELAPPAVGEAQPSTLVCTQVYYILLLFTSYMELSPDLPHYIFLGVVMGESATLAFYLCLWYIFWPRRCYNAPVAHKDERSASTDELLYPYNFSDKTCN